jgi:hypothetical protein
VRAFGSNSSTHRTIDTLCRDLLNGNSFFSESAVVISGSGPAFLLSTGYTKNGSAQIQEIVAFIKFI